MSSPSNELHIQIVNFDFNSLVKKVNANVKATVGRENTELAYNPKKAEFEEFFDIIYANDHNPRTITIKKKFLFMYYTAYRKKRLGGRYTVKNRKYFNFLEYQDVISHKNLSDDVVEYQCFNQHYCAIKELSGHQRQENLTDLRNDDLKTESMNDLIKHVKNRAEVVSRLTFKERLDGTYAPFKLASEVNTIEDFIWNDHNMTGYYSGSSMHDRFQFLMTLGSISRSESLYKADLSDLCDFIFKQRLEIDPYHILIMKIGFGKTINGNHAIYARGMRHSDVRLCPIGALGMWLLHRFFLANAIKTINFRLSNTWFNKKLLIPMYINVKASRSGNNDIHEDRMTDRQYTKRIRGACNSLNLQTNKYLHFGRETGSALLEIEEVHQDDINALRNWCKDVFHEHYSSNLPLSAMRAIAGFDNRYVNKIE